MSTSNTNLEKTTLAALLLMAAAGVYTRQHCASAAPEVAAPIPAKTK